VHDLVDYVSGEARLAGGYAAGYLSGKRPARQLRVKAGSNVRYVSPGKVDPDTETRLYLRSMIVKNKAELEVRWGGRVIKSLKLGHVQPSEMISVVVKKTDFNSAAGLTDDDALEVAVL
jgi:hypothetical protein